jgi:hypothetical protein
VIKIHVILPSLYEKGSRTCGQDLQRRDVPSKRRFKSIGARGCGGVESPTVPLWGI